MLRALGIAAAAAAIPLAILLWYHRVCFGSPFRTGYDTSQTFAHFHKQGFLGMTRPHADAFWGSFFTADNGLFVLSPWLVLAVPGAVLLWRRGQRAMTLTCVAVALIFVFFISSITFWRGGWGVGPRYVTAMLPFLLPLVATTFDALRTRGLALGAVCGTIVSAVVVYTLSAATFPYWPDALKNPLYEVTFRLVHDRAFAPNVLSALGWFGIAPFVLGAFALAGWAIQRAAGWRGLALACVVGAAILGAFALAPRTPDHGQRAYVQTVFPAVTQ